jgi:peroxiredoxin
MPNQTLFNESTTAPAAANMRSGYGCPLIVLSRKDIAVGVVILGLVATLLYRVVPYFRVFNVEVGDRAPSFDLRTGDGAGLALSGYEGKWVLLNFWATYCKPCVDEMPSLNALHKELKDRGLIVVGISIDEDAEAYSQFIAQMGIVFPTGRDPERQVMSQYGTRLVPETYLIDPQGTVIRKYVNWQDWGNSEIINYLRSLL